jgi:hypothetical protein
MVILIGVERRAGLAWNKVKGRHGFWKTQQNLMEDEVLKSHSNWYYIQG